MAPQTKLLIMRTPLIETALDSQMHAIASSFETLQELDGAIVIYRAHVALSPNRERLVLAEDMLEQLRSMRRNHTRELGFRYMCSLLTVAANEPHERSLFALAAQPTTRRENRSRIAAR
jgi:hypothetical protein